MQFFASRRSAAPRFWLHLTFLIAPALVFGSANGQTPAQQSPAPAKPSALTPAAVDQSGKDDDYNQWKLSLGAGRATDPQTITAPPGFRVELLRSATAEEGSWISLCFDPQGRVIVGRESKGLLRFTLALNAAAEQQVAKVETINDSLLECRGLLWAYDAIYANANNSKGLYRLRDSDGDGSFEDVQLLRATPGNVGHGRNDLVLGPDGLIYSIHGDDVQMPADFQLAASPLRGVFDERLLPCDWDGRLFNSVMKLPGGQLVRTDKNGEHWEVVAGGLRNPYGVDFNADGELFTYDADMEWDVGLPWYRPTRVIHLVSGADFGWRRGTGPWRAWLPDSPPTNGDIGLGSPTAVRFGTRSHFPKPFQQALFICDWAYGRILAVHCEPHGASYVGSSEPFLSGRPLNVTDLEFGPDGAMYFLTGGRKTQSGLYRVSFVGSSPSSTTATAPTSAPVFDTKQLAAAQEARALRRRLEAFHGRIAADAIDFAWPQLKSADPWIRHAARTVIEHQPIDLWQSRALSEADVPTKLVALLALARVAPADQQSQVQDQLLAISWANLRDDEKIVTARALAVSLARGGAITDERRQQLDRSLSPRFPDAAPRVNELLCELLVFAQSPSVVAKTLKLLVTAKPQEEKFHYLFVLRLVRSPWTLAERRQYFEWLRQANHFYGAHYLPKFLGWMKADAVATLTEQEKQQLAALLADPPPPADAPPLIARPFVRNWELDDLVGSLEQLAAPRDAAAGKAIFAAALCAKCHRFAGEGSPVGPDLTEVARRFGPRDLLLSLLAPSHAIDEKYRGVNIVTVDGRAFAGQIVGDDERSLTIVPNLLAPDAVVKLPKEQIETQTPSLVSPMPAGLLNTFSKNEILDLLAYLLRGRQATTRSAN